MESNAYSIPVQPLMEDSRVKRSIIVRVIFSLLWLIPVVMVINMIVGGIVGGIAGYNVVIMEQAADAARDAVQQFFANYMGKLFFVDFVVWLGLSIIGVLPGTAKFKRVRPKNTRL